MKNSKKQKIEHLTSNQKIERSTSKITKHQSTRYGLIDQLKHKQKRIDEIFIEPEGDKKFKHIRKNSVSRETKR